MAAGVQSRFARTCRRALRWGICLALLVAAAFGLALLYLRWMGVPRFVKARIEHRLRANGLALEIDVLRLSGFGLVAENARLGSVHPELRLQALLGRVELSFQPQAIRRGRLAPEKLLLERAQAGRTPAGSNAGPAHLFIEDLGAELRFRGNDHWELARLDGRLFNAQVHAVASVTNLTDIRQWPAFKTKDEPKSDWSRRVAALLDDAQELRLDSASRINLRLRGDGRQPASFDAQLHVRAPKAAYRGRTLEMAEIEASVFPDLNALGVSQGWLNAHVARGAVSGDPFQGAALASQWAGSVGNRTLDRIEWQLRLDQLQTLSADLQKLVVSGTTLPALNSPGMFDTELRADAADVQSPWGGARASNLTAQFRHGRSSSAPWDARWRLASSALRFPRGELLDVRLSGHAAPSFTMAQWQPVDESWGPWAMLEPFELEWDAAVQRLKSPELEADRLVCAGQWRAPELVVDRLSADLRGGKVESVAWMDVASREVHSDAFLNFDVRQVSSLLTPVSRKWLGQFDWQTPPAVTASAGLRLPPWTEQRPRWREEVMPTITLAGEFAGSDGSFRGVPVAYASSHFAFTNLVWRLPDLFVKRPDGDAKLAYVGDMGTHEFHWRVEASLPPKALKPLFDAEAVARTIDQLTFTTAPSVQGDVWGRWNEPESLRFTGSVAATNFTFRGERCDHLSGLFRLTNSMLCFSDVTVKRQAEQITVPSGSFDLIERVIYVTNALSSMDPDLVTKVIGPKIRAAVRPYAFRTPPTVLVNGRLPTFRIQDADVRFEVAGQAFSYWKLNARSVMGDVHWRGDSLSITNVRAAAYGGEVDWKGSFDFSVPVGAQFSFEGTARNVGFHALMADLGKRTNNLHGSLDGRLVVTRANSDDWRSWEGFGNVRLRNGFLWDIPIFGFFSPVLNTVIPGLGNSPISAGDATFTIKQSVVRSSDLELKSPALRLSYTGTVDFKGNLEARMQAEILRDAWAVGKAVSLALWPLSKAFEYQLAGTVSQPKTEPVYIPKILLWPLNPVKSIQRLFDSPKAEPKPGSGGLFDTP